MKRFRLDPDTGFRHVPVVPAAGWDEQDEHVMLRWPYVGLLERYEREPVLICSPKEFSNPSLRRGPNGPVDSWTWLVRGGCVCARVEAQS